MYNFIVSGKKKFSSTLLSPSGWLKNYIDMKQINRRRIKQKFNNLYTWERPRKTSKWPEWLKPSPSIPSSAKDKRGCWGSWFGTSKGRKAIHTEREKPMFGRHVFAGSGRDKGIQSGL